MKTLITSALLSLALMLASCGSADAGASALKTITDGLAKVTTSFNGIKDKASAETAIGLAEKTLPSAKTAFESLSKLGSAAGAPDAVKGLLTKATEQFGGFKSMLGGLAAKFAGKADISKLIGDKLPALMKMLPGM